MGLQENKKNISWWGQVWLDKAREDDLRGQVANDPHSPAKFRINGVVRNIPEFYTAFNIKPTDSYI
jgi:putative endopeptidase